MMNWIPWFVAVLAILLILSTLVISWVIYSALLRRTRKDKWARQPSMPEDEQYVQLYAQALSWRDQYLSCKRDVSIVNDGLRLYGEYFDFGSDKAVIIIPGRMEACYYSCHYTEPYRKAGWNVLTIDGRAHGFSEGKTNSLGYKEYRDILAWAEMLHDKENVGKISLHGVCIGASTAVFAAVDPSCQDYVEGIVVDGLYQRFYDSFYNHMTMFYRPVFPILLVTMLFIKWFSSADVVHDGPLYRMNRMNKHILFLHSKEDVFSTPDKVQELFDMCPSMKKEMVWFEHGGHSRIRITEPIAYDRAIMNYLSKSE